MGSGGPHEILSTRTETPKLLKRATKTSRRQLKPKPAGRYRTRAITRSITATVAKTYALRSADPIR